MHIHYFFYIKTFKIAPTCFDPKIIFRELHRSLLKSHFQKHSLINLLILTRCCGSMSYCVSRTVLRMCLPMCVVCYAAWDSRNITHDTHTRYTSIFRLILSSVRLTQYNMLPQHRVNIRRLISECLWKCDFSKEQCSSLKMILELKHVERF